jgi:hypothetical protein
MSPNPLIGREASEGSRLMGLWAARVALPQVSDFKAPLQARLFDYDQNADARDTIS